MTRKKKGESITDVYARIRKPMPPPERVERNRRREDLEELEESEADDEAGEIPKSRKN